MYVQLAPISPALTHTHTHALHTLYTLFTHTLHTLFSRMCSVPCYTKEAICLLLFVFPKPMPEQSRDNSAQPLCATTLRPRPRSLARQDAIAGTRYPVLAVTIDDPSIRKRNSIPESQLYHGLDRALSVKRLKLGPPCSCCTRNTRTKVFDWSKR